jgi:hypothetical protein
LSVSGADVRFDEDVEYLADGALLSDRFAQRQVSLDLVAGDDAVAAAFGDVERRGDVADADPGSWANTRGPGRVVRKLDSAIAAEPS